MIITNHTFKLKTAASSNNTEEKISHHPELQVLRPELIYIHIHKDHYLDIISLWKTLQL